MTYLKKAQKIILTAAVSFAFALCLTAGVFAADDKYYMIDGRIYPDGGAEINRVELIENITSVNTKSGETYALFAFDEYGGEVSSVGVPVNFELNADAGGGLSEYSEFCVLIPYNEKIAYFVLYDGEYQEIDEVYLNDGIQVEIEYFTAEEKETEGGYNLEWNVKLRDGDYADMLEYDVLTVSRESGESNVLAYRTGETSLFVPYEWLDPNDTVVFTLKSSDSFTTLTAESTEFSTPLGKEKIIADDEEWSDEAPDDYDGEVAIWLYLALVAGTVIIFTAIVVIIIIILNKKKKKDGKK